MRMREEGIDFEQSTNAFLKWVAIPRGCKNWPTRRPRATCSNAVRSGWPRRPSAPAVSCSSGVLRSPGTQRLPGPEPKHRAAQEDHHVENLRTSASGSANPRSFPTEGGYAASGWITLGNRPPMSPPAASSPQPISTSRRSMLWAEPRRNTRENRRAPHRGTAQALPRRSPPGGGETLRTEASGWPQSRGLNPQGGRDSRRRRL